jgi:hypothetical protein
MNFNRAFVGAFTAAAILAASIAFADSFTGRLLMLPQWTHSKTVGASTVTETFASLIDWTHTSGTLSNQMNAIARETATLTNGESRVVSLAGGYSDAFGDATTFTAVRFLAVQAAAGNYADIMFGGAAANAWTNALGSASDFVKIRPGGSFVLVAPLGIGYGVGGGNCCITNAGASNATYTIYIGGAE